MPCQKAIRNIIKFLLNLLEVLLDLSKVLCSLTFCSHQLTVNATAFQPDGKSRFFRKNLVSTFSNITPIQLGY